MNRNSEVSLVAADAFVMFYDNGLGKWMASGVSKSVTIARVQILQNLVSNQFRIYAWNPATKEILLSSVLYHNLRYQKAHATFHEWRDADTQLVYGIHFADTKEANVFGDVISKVFNSLEIIYKQCKELQEKIQSNCPSESTQQQLQKQTSPTKSINIPNENLLQIVSNNNPAAVSKKQSSEEFNLPTYENINVVLSQQSQYHSANIKTLSTGSDTTEINNPCQSSSDDSVRGLKRQPSSSASSGYATVASLVDQYSPLPGKGTLGTNPSATPLILSQTVVEATSVVSACDKVSPDEITQSSFASQLQSAVQLRKKNSNSNTVRSNTADGELVRATSPPSNKTISCNNPIDDIMSEMKRKLERRKQLIDGHSDPNYSSSTDKSDVCSSASDGGSFVSNAEPQHQPQQLPQQISSPTIHPSTQLPHSSSGTCRSQVSEMSSDNKTLQEDEDKSQETSDIKDGNVVNKPSSQKRQAGDYTQSTTSTSSACPNIEDLNGLKKIIIDEIRKEILEMKKELLDVIRTQRNKQW